MRRRWRSRPIAMASVATTAGRRTPRRRRPKGLDLAARALELGRDDSNVLWMVAHAMLRLGMDRERAKELAYSSLALNPNSAIAMTIAALTEVMSGNRQRAGASGGAQRLSPRDPRGWLTLSVLSLAYLTDGQFEEAASFARNPWCTIPAWVSVAGPGREPRHHGTPGAAAEVIQQLLKLEPQLSLSTLRARLMYMDERVWSRLSAGCASQDCRNS